MSLRVPIIINYGENSSQHQQRQLIHKRKKLKSSSKEPIFLSTKGFVKKKGHGNVTVVWMITSSLREPFNSGQYEYMNDYLNDMRQFLVIIDSR